MTRLRARTVGAPLLRVSNWRASTLIACFQALDHARDGVPQVYGAKTPEVGAKPRMNSLESKLMVREALPVRFAD